MLKSKSCLQFFLNLSLDLDDRLGSYCQMLCMGLGGDPLFNNPIHKFYSINNFSEALRVV